MKYLYYIFWYSQTPVIIDSQQASYQNVMPMPSPALPMIMPAPAVPQIMPMGPMPHQQPQMVPHIVPLGYWSMSLCNRELSVLFNTDELR